MLVHETPEEWSLDSTVGEIVVNPFAYYGLLPARKLLHHEKMWMYLVESSGKFLLWYESTGYIDEITGKCTLDDICACLPDTSSLDIHPLVRANTKSSPNIKKTIVQAIPEECKLDMDTEEYPFRFLGLPPSRTLIYTRKENTFLVECAGNFLLWNDISNDVVEILEPYNIEDIIKLLPNDQEMKTVYFDKSRGKMKLQNGQLRTSYGVPTYEFDARGCSGWPTIGLDLGAETKPFHRYGLAPAKLRLYNSKTRQYLAESGGMFFEWNAISGAVTQIVEPQSFGEINKILGTEVEPRFKYLKRV